MHMYLPCTHKRIAKKMELRKKQVLRALFSPPKSLVVLV